MNNLTEYPFYHSTIPNLIYVHITKTGGTSIRQSMKFNHINKELGQRKHYTSKQIIEIVGEQAWNRAFKFSFVRNPFARMVSLYQYERKMNLGESNHYNRLIFNQNPDVNYREWLLDLLENRNGDANPRNLETQKRYLQNNKGKVELDFVGRFESLEYDFNRLCDQLGVDVELKHLNKSAENSSKHRDWYDRGSKNLIENYFKEDLDYFDYSY